MKAVLTISVFESLGNNLITREAASDFLATIEENICEVIEFDFSDVEFMSRSFADQFHKEKVKLSQKYSTLFEVVNANEEILNVLRTVASTQTKKERKIREVSTYKYSDVQILSNYLLSI